MVASAETAEQDWDYLSSGDDDDDGEPEVAGYVGSTNSTSVSRPASVGSSSALIAGFVDPPAPVGTPAALEPPRGAAHSGPVAWEPERDPSIPRKATSARNPSLA